MEENKNNLEELNIDETIYTTTLNKKYKNREKWTKADPKKVFSFIPGTVVEISVKPGDKVKPGDNLYILDAMKMNNQVQSEIDGEIAQVHIATGDRVPKNKLLIEYK